MFYKALPECINALKLLSKENKNTQVSLVQDPCICSNRYQAQQWSMTNMLQLEKHVRLTQGFYFQELRKYQTCTLYSAFGPRVLFKSFLIPQCIVKPNLLRAILNFFFILFNTSQHPISLNSTYRYVSSHRQAMITRTKIIESIYHKKVDTWTNVKPIRVSITFYQMLLVYQASQNPRNKSEYFPSFQNFPSKRLRKIRNFCFFHHLFFQ